MRDLLSWAIPLYRAFGIQVRVHLLFFIVTLGLFLRQVVQPGNIVWWGDIFLFTIVLLFTLVLLHEYGHCFGGRGVGGEAEEILIWPLGGLAFVNVPKEWRAHFFTAFAGPLVNIVICFLTGVTVTGAGFVPSLNPLANPYVSEMRCFKDGPHNGRLFTSEYGLRVYQPGTADEVPNDEFRSKLGKNNELNEAVVRAGYDRALAPGWVVWLNRVFWLSWLMLLINLVPAHPLDGGQMLHALLWWRAGYRQATITATYVGAGCGVLVLIGAVTTNESLLMGLGLYIIFSSITRLRTLDEEEGAYGFDTVGGYVGLEEPPPRARRVGLFRRWIRARVARRLRREAEQRKKDEERLDQLLDKIAHQGMTSLTDEERRFMERVSERHRGK